VANTLDLGSLKHNDHKYSQSFVDEDSVKTSAQINTANFTEAESPRLVQRQRSARFVIDLINGKWKLSILFVLQTGPIRYSQLRKSLPNASKKMLTQHLREMEQDGLIIRRDLSGRSRYVEYCLSESLGVAAMQLLEILSHWPTSLPPQINK